MNAYGEKACWASVSHVMNTEVAVMSCWQTGLTVQRLSWGVGGEEESEGVEFGVVDGHVAHQTFMQETGVYFASVLHTNICLNNDLSLTLNTQWLPCAQKAKILKTLVLIVIWDLSSNINVLVHH